MVIRLGRYGEFLACSLYPEHKETRPLAGRAGGPDAGAREAARGAARGRRRRGLSQVRRRRDGGVLALERGRFGPFVGCSRYPECDYIKKDGPPPPEPLGVRGRVPALPARATS